MSRDGYLPDNVRECDVPGNRPGDSHDDRCRAAEDAPEYHPECGGVGRCECWDHIPRWRRWLWRLWYKDCEVDADPDCNCADIADDDAAAYADHCEDEAERRAMGD